MRVDQNSAVNEGDAHATLRAAEVLPLATAGCETTTAPACVPRYTARPHRQARAAGRPAARSRFVHAVRPLPEPSSKVQARSRILVIFALATNHVKYVTSCLTSNRRAGAARSAGARGRVPTRDTSRGPSTESIRDGWRAPPRRMDPQAELLCRSRLLGGYRVCIASADVFTSPFAPAARMDVNGVASDHVQRPVRLDRSLACQKQRVKNVRKAVRGDAASLRFAFTSATDV